jgi:Tol biopolymer transport system component
VAGAIEKALELRPENRYQTPEQFKLALLAASSLPPARLGVFRVTPPPEPTRKDLSSEELEGLLEHPAPLKSPEGSAGNSPVDLVGVDRSLRQPPANLKRKRARTGCAVISAVMILIAGLGAVIYRQDPDLTRRVMVSMLVSPSVAPVPAEVTASPAISPTATVQETVLQDGQLQASKAAVLPSSVLTSVTNAPTSMPELPTRTMTAAPTPVGGGAGQIAYASEKDGVPQIFIIRSDGSDRKQITDISEGACQPDFSPSGDQIVFISPCASSNDYYPGSSLYIINLDGTGLLPLPTMVGGDYDPTWSPDGQIIAFTSLRNNNRPQIYTLNLEDQSIRALSQKYLLDSQPSWSPDGQKILFVAERAGRQDIWVMDRDGQNQTQFTRTPNLIDLHPSFSSQGQDVLITQYVALGGVPRVVIAHFDLEDYVEYQIGKEKRPMRDAVMSPDGYWIAFEGWEAGTKHNIYLVTTTGISVQQVTDDPLMSFDPVWRPLPAN